MKKKLVIVIAAILSVACFAACADSSSEGTSSAKAESSSVNVADSSVNDESKTADTETQPVQTEEQQPKETQSPAPLNTAETVVLGKRSVAVDDKITEP